MLTEPVIVLVATVGGTATFVAEELAVALRERGAKVFVVPMEKAAIAMFATRKLFVIVSSTHGRGDVPDNGIHFFETLRGERPDLGGVRYGTVALGDMTYASSFCGGGAKFDRIFEERGATRLVARLEHDRRSGTFPEEEALVWLEGWLAAAESSAAA